MVSVVGKVVIKGKEARLMILVVLPPEIAKLVVLTGATPKLATASCSVELLIVMLPIGADAVPTTPLALVMMMGPPTTVMELVPPPCVMVAAFTVPLMMFKVPFARVVEPLIQ